MRLSISSAALALLLSVSPSVAQPQQPSGDFKASVELVLVPTVVTDKSGRHISGLHASDFSILYDKNKAPRIAFCEEIAHAPHNPQLAALPPGAFSNLISSSDAQRPRNPVVIAIDTINTPFNDQAYARQGIIKYLSQSVLPGTPVALLFMTPSGVRMLHDFTTDSATLVAALQKVSKNGSKSEGNLAFPKAAGVVSVDSEADQLTKFELNGYVGDTSKEMIAMEIDFLHRNAMADTTAALTQIANMYSGVPGRKALVWITSGLPRSIDLALRNFTRDVKVRETDVSGDFDRGWKSLTDAGFAVYAVDASGLFVGPAYSGTVPPSGSIWKGGSPLTHRSNDPIPDLVHQETFNTLQTISDLTGGRAFLNTNDLAKGIRSAIEDSDSYYLLGIYPAGEGTTPGWHPLKVKVDQPGALVRSRKGFIVSRTPVTSVERARADLMLALRSPVQFSGLPLMLHLPSTTRPAVAGDDPSNSQTNTRKRVDFDLMLGANSFQVTEGGSTAMSVGIAGVAQNAAGDNIASLQQSINRKVSSEEAANLRRNGLLYKGSFELTPGKYTLHLAVRDNLSGKLGSIIAPLVVE